MKRGSKRMRWSIMIIIVSLGMVVYAQYGLSSSANPEKTGKPSAVAETEGEWLEFVDGVVIVSQVRPEQAKPTTLPYVYLSKDWDACVEYTLDAPDGRACSDVFDMLLKNAERFDVKHTS